MIYKSVILLMLITFNISASAPPIVSKDIQENINDVHKKFNVLSGQFEKFNLLYLNKLEPNLVTYAALLATIDANIRNLQERAHVWDTFQLHISAWNDQLAALDRKIDIISKGQEKLFALDTKINDLGNLEYKLDAILKKLEETKDFVLQTHGEKHDHLFEEFATRGVFSTLKLMERKLDKIQIISQNFVGKSFSDSHTKEKIKLKCNTHNLEDTLNDVSSKVDIIFDKINAKEDGEELDEYIGDELVSTINYSKNDMKQIKNILKPINQSCKTVLNTLQELNYKIDYIGNKTNTNNFGKCNLDNVIRVIKNSERTRDNILASYFMEQRSHFESRLHYYLDNHCVDNARNDTAHANVPSKTDSNFEGNLKNGSESLFVSPEFIDVTKTSCDQLEETDIDGVYKFESLKNESFNIRYCKKIEGRWWTVIQNRGNDIQQNFNLSWFEYKNGFGNIENDFWVGNEFIYTISQEKCLILRVDLESFDGLKAWAEYDNFKILSEKENYKLLIGSYVGNASDSFSSHNNSMFSTYDRKNDVAPDCCPCAVSYGGGWWFNSCFEANLNGEYYTKPMDNDYYRGIIWENWLGNYSLKKTRMAVREVIETTSENIPESTTIPYYEDP